MFPAVKSAMAGPFKIGHLHTASGLMTPLLSVMLLPVSVQVEAAQRANWPWQIVSGTVEFVPEAAESIEENFFRT